MWGGKARLSCGFIRNCYRRACCIRSELCCTQSSIFICAAGQVLLGARADPLALQPAFPLPAYPLPCCCCRPAYCFAGGSISRCRLSLPAAIFHFAAYILHRWRWRLCRECFVICGIKNVAILLPLYLSVFLCFYLSLSASLFRREAATAAAAVFECTFSAINHKLLLPLLLASYVCVSRCACVCFSLCACVLLCAYLCVCDLAFYCCNANTNLYWHRKGKNLCRRNSLHIFPPSPSNTHWSARCLQRGKSQVGSRCPLPLPLPYPCPAPHFLLLTPQRQSHMQCQYLYLLSMRVARKWRLPFVGFPLPLGPPSLLRCGFFFAILSFTIWGLCGHWSNGLALPDWGIYTASIPSIQCNESVFFILFPDIGKSLCHRYICARVCVSDMSGKWLLIFIAGNWNCNAMQPLFYYFLFAEWE